MVLLAMVHKMNAVRAKVDDLKIKEKWIRRVYLGTIHAFLFGFIAYEIYIY